MSRKVWGVLLAVVILGAAGSISVKETSVAYQEGPGPHGIVHFD